jgi:hypothetical protein
MNFVFSHKHFFDLYSRVFVLRILKKLWSIFKWSTLIFGDPESLMLFCSWFTSFYFCFCLVQEGKVTLGGMQPRNFLHFPLLKAIHSQLSVENKTGHFMCKTCKHEHKLRHLIGQTIIMWPFYAVSENVGKDHINCTRKDANFWVQSSDFRVQSAVSLFINRLDL